MKSRETLLQIVDPEGRTVGVAEKLSAHQGNGLMHRAFSVLLLDAHGRMLLQQRALTKYHSPGVWSNTCCGHPHPGEYPITAAKRRTGEEIGVRPATLEEIGTVAYHLVDPATGLVENEFNHVFVGLAPATPLAPDPGEVAATSFVTPQELTAHLAAASFSNWFRIVFDAALPAIRSTFPETDW